VLRLKVLGGLSIQRDGRAVTGALAQPRRLAVLALLARGGQTGVSRDRLLTTLWPDTQEERARHTFNQTLYAIRRELGDDDAIIGMRELRLNTEVLAVDVLEFQAAVAARDLQRAADVYDGPFADGFYLPGADEFERWVERERAALDRTYTNAVEQLAREATSRGDHERAVDWWRARAARDPLEARVAIALMQSLDASGDRRGAIQHARVYELLIDEELSLPPDRDVVRFADSLRREQPAAPIVATGAAAPAMVAEPPVLEVADEPAVAAALPNVSPPGVPFQRPIVLPRAEFVLTPTRSAHTEELPVRRRAAPRPFRRRALSAASMLAAVMALGMVAVQHNSASAAKDDPLIAVGRITDYRRGESALVAGSLTDLLATNLGRTRGVRVVSTAHMYDMLRRFRDGRDTTSSAFATVARQAGADELIDGALYDRDGHLRLDLRRIDLVSGAVRAAYSVEAPDVFALADSGTSRLTVGLGLGAP